MYILEDEILQDTALIKLLSAPSIIEGYFKGGRFKQITHQQAVNFVEKKQKELYKSVQLFLFDSEEIELTFKNEECYNWWNTLLDNVGVVSELEYKWSSREKEPTGYYLITIPKPPKYIFEEI